LLQNGIIVSLVARSNLRELEIILDAIHDDSTNVIGALMWSGTDNWKWGTFDHHLALPYVNPTSQERRYERSILDAVDFVKSRRGTGLQGRKSPVSLPDGPQ
jgi:hypothetical protein